jgi:hypothetical protein
MKNYPLWAATLLVLFAAMLLTADTGNFHFNYLWVADELYLGSSYFTPTSLYVNGGASLVSTGTFSIGTGVSLSNTSATLPGTTMNGSLYVSGTTNTIQVGTGVLLTNTSATLPGTTMNGNSSVSGTFSVTGSSATLPATSVSSLKINGTTISPGGGGTASCSGSTHVTSITYSISASGVISLSTTCS